MAAPKSHPEQVRREYAQRHLPPAGIDPFVRGGAGPRSYREGEQRPAPGRVQAFFEGLADAPWGVPQGNSSVLHRLHEAAFRQRFRREAWLSRLDGDSHLARSVAGPRSQAALANVAKRRTIACSLRTAVTRRRCPGTLAASFTWTTTAAHLAACARVADAPVRPGLHRQRRYSIVRMLTPVALRRSVSGGSLRRLA